MGVVLRTSIQGLGACIPEKVLTNFDLEKIVDTTDEWIRTRTGIRERRIAEKGTCASDLGAPAAMEAIRNAGIQVSDLDLIIVASITPDCLFPSTACMVQHKIGARCGAFDLLAACSGFPYALSVADAFIRSGQYKNILAVGAEVLSSFIDWKDRSTCVLFGDGAGAAVLSRSKGEHEIIASHLGSDGAQANILKIPAGGSAMPPTMETVKGGFHYLQMQGSELFKVAVRTMDEAARKVVNDAGYSVKDIDWLIPHQANDRILQAVAARLELPPEKVYINVDRYGNTSGASTVVALHEAVRDGKIKKGDNVVLVAFGGGLTWAATLIRW